MSAVQLGTLIKVVALIHDVPGQRLPALKGRFANFLKLGFPDVRAVGTGSRAEYWPSHVAQTLVAFELLRFRMPQTAAAHAVSSFALAVETAAGEAALRLTGVRREGPRTVLAVSSNALLGDAKRLELGDIGIEAVIAAPEAFTRARTVLAVDMERLIESAARAAQSTDEPFDVSFFKRLGSGWRNPPRD